MYPVLYCAQVADLVMTEFFDQGDKERNELKIQPQVIIPFYCNKPYFVIDEIRHPDKGTKSKLKVLYHSYM